MSTYNHNIELFNLYAMDLKIPLEAWYEAVEDFSFKLFKGCDAVLDEKFRERLLWRRIKPRIPTANDLCWNKYKNMKRDGKWNALLEDRNS